MRVSEITTFPELPMCAGVYAVYNTVEQRAYIGKATRLTRRLSDHFQMFHRRKHFNGPLGEIAERTGADDWRYFVLEIVADKKELAERERYWIGQFEPCDLYNVSGVARGAVDG